MSSLFVISSHFGSVAIVPVYGIPLCRAWMEVGYVPFDLVVAYLCFNHSAFVGLAVMVALIPVPTWLATRMSGMQKEKMKCVK